MDKSWLSFSPATSEVTSYAGESVAFRILASASKPVEGVVNIGIIDSRGVIEPSVALTYAAPQYLAELRTAASLSAGTYSGNLEVRLCRDDPRVCAQPVAGSPWQVPYRFTILAASNLSALTPLAGAGAWTTYQGNAAHTGFVNATVQASGFNRRWVVPATVGSLAVDDGRVLITPPDNRAGAVVALAERDGTEQWRYGGNAFMGGVAAANGNVWLTSQSLSDPTQTTRLLKLEAGTGRVLGTTDLSQFSLSPRLAPVVSDGGVFFASDSASTISRHREADGAQQWRALFNYPYAQPAYRWTPAVGSGRAVMFDYHRLWWADTATGAMQGPIEGPNSAPGISGVWEVSGAPVLGPGSLVYVSAYYTGNGIAYDSGRLVAFDLSRSALAWNVGTTVRSNPVLAGNVVYVAVTGGALQAHDSTTGALLWRWDVPAAPVLPPSLAPPSVPPFISSGPNQPLLVVGQLAFMGYGNVTYAIDLSTRQSVWQYPAAGPMAVSANGTLFIGTETQLHAINLR